MTTAHSQEQLLVSLLQESIRQYQRQKELLTKIQTSLVTRTGGNFGKLVQEFDHLQQESVSHDSLVASTMESYKNDPPIKLKSLLSERIHLMQEIRQINHVLLDKAENVKVLLQQELKKLHAGRGAMRGYLRNSQTKKGFLQNVY